MAQLMLEKYPKTTRGMAKVYIIIVMALHSMETGILASDKGTESNKNSNTSSKVPGNRTKNTANSPFTTN